MSLDATYIKEYGAIPDYYKVELIDVTKEISISNLHLVCTKYGTTTNKSDIISVFQVPMKLITGVRKKRTLWLNVNNIHTTHHARYNSAKRAFKKLVAKELGVRDILHSNNYILDYLIFLPNKLNRDVSNVGSVIDKFTADAYVELGFAPDDNYKYLQKISYEYGGYDLNKQGFAQVTVSVNRKRRKV